MATMNIQIFGTNKCFDTKKAVRYFKERNIKYQLIDIKEKEMSKGELTSVVQAVGGLDLHHYITMLLVPIVFLIFGTIAIAIGFSMRPVGQYHVHFLNLFYIYWSKASLLKAGGLVFKALGAVSALYMMTLTTPLSEIIAVLRKAHIPKLIIELMNMIYRYIFIMIDTHSRMKNSAESRLGYCDFKTSCYSFGQVASNLLVVSLKRGNNYYNALEARCYDGDLRFLEEEKPLKAGQIVMAVIFIVVLLLIWFFTR